MGGGLVSGKIIVVRGVAVIRENTAVQVNPQTNDGSLGPGIPTLLYLAVLIEAAIMEVGGGGGESC